MIGVTAVALDEGYRIVVVMAGGKDDLRQQTARRFNTQLVRQRDEVPGVPGAYTLAPGETERPNGGIALPFSVDIHQWAPGFLRIRSALAKKEPCIFVIKKNMASLAAMRAYLGRAYSEFGYGVLPTLILDDECDDASVDRVDAPIPEAIANLWRHLETPPVAYVGYTATAAANLLQAPDNELYPEHFVYLLRYPNEDGSSLTFKEPNPDRWYSGSTCFYEAFGTNSGASENFLVNTSVQAQEPDGPIEQNSSLHNAVRAYLVAGAYRFALQPGADFSKEGSLPRPHSMLIQTSQLMGEHERIVIGLTAQFGGNREADGSSTINGDQLRRALQRDEKPWRSWYDEFSRTRERLYLERPSPRVAGQVTWERVRELIPVVASHVRIKAVNSDPKLGQELDYSPGLMEDGTVCLPRDIYVIVVGGSKLSRGITVEGLTISYFTRWAPNPADDTILQISRWFGYRGEELPFCRLFTTNEIHEALCEIHENDKDLRAQLAHLMASHQTPRQAGLVLRCNPRALPTSKLGVGKLYDVGFSPYQCVFSHVEVGVMSSQNVQAACRLIQGIRRRNAETISTLQGAVRGELSRGWSALEVADILDSISYSLHNPSLAGNPTSEFHRKPREGQVTSVLPYRSDPYQVAAYLREWTHLAAKGEAARPPDFEVGYSRGGITEDAEPFDYPLLNRVVTAEGKLIGQWTGRSGGWRGDALFDDPDPRLLLQKSVLRGNGLRGLLLLYVIHKAAQGRDQRGGVRAFHTPTFGISIPEGGPMLRRVTVVPQ
jgi:hypothetical protein